MTLSLVLFTTGLLGIVLNRKNLIMVLICLELLLLAVTLIIIFSSYGLTDGTGQLFGVYIIVVAGAESAIGLGILVAYYRLRGTIALQ